MRFIEELKKRKLAQWMAGYFAVAWGLLEVLSFLTNQFALPQFVVRSATVIVATGFLVALTLAWHHGDKGRQRITGVETITLAVIVIAGGILTLLVNLPDSDDLTDLEGLGAISGPVTRMTIALPRDQRLGIQQGGSLSLAISPDGTRIAYVAETNEGIRLVVRPFDNFEATVLAGTDYADQPFFSPDGEWIGFFTPGEMRKVPIHGGEPITITTFDGAIAGASWGANDQILYSLLEQGLWLISSSGGDPEKVTVTSAAATDAGVIDPALNVIGIVLEWPSFLPGDERAIVTDGSSVLLLTLATGELRRLISVSGRQARYLRSGFLVFTETGEHVRAVSFDPDNPEITGQPFPVLDNVFRAPGGGAVFFDVSRTGTLVYVTGGFQRSLVLADRNGRTELITDEKRGFRFPRFSPDGDRIVVTVDPRPSSIWIYDTARGLGEKITMEGHNYLPIWQVDSGNIIHMHGLTLRSINPQRPDLSKAFISPDHRLNPTLFPTTSSTDGKIIAGNAWNNDTGLDIYTVTTGEALSYEPFLRSQANESEPDISPDGNWISYVSNTTGRNEVYVQHLTIPGARHRISNDGGVDPVWSRDGRRLFYRRGDYIMVATVETKPTISFSEPDILFRAELDTTQIRNWDVGPDDRFVLVESDPATTREFQVVLNWFKTVQDAAN
ncbi:MAG: hypothetical protein O6946_03185 [Gammaproteobacteria bacterium]|nr:hypothetical protein [Gammaproteobacteria bacterium]